MTKRNTTQHTIYTILNMDNTQGMQYTKCPTYANYNQQKNTIARKYKILCTQLHNVFRSKRYLNNQVH